MIHRNNSSKKDTHLTSSAPQVSETNVLWYMRSWIASIGKDVAKLHSSEEVLVLRWFALPPELRRLPRLRVLDTWGRTGNALDEAKMLQARDKRRRLPILEQGGPCWRRRWRGRWRGRCWPGGSRPHTGNDATRESSEEGGEVRVGPVELALDHPERRPGGGRGCGGSGTRCTGGSAGRKLGTVRQRDRRRRRLRRRGHKGGRPHDLVPLRHLVLGDVRKSRDSRILDQIRIGLVVGLIHRLLLPGPVRPLDLGHVRVAVRPWMASPLRVSAPGVVAKAGLQTPPDRTRAEKGVRRGALEGVRGCAAGEDHGVALRAAPGDRLPDPDLGLQGGVAVEDAAVYLREPVVGGGRRPAPAVPVGRLAGAPAAAHHVAVLHDRAVRGVRHPRGLGAPGAVWTPTVRLYGGEGVRADLLALLLAAD